MAGQAAARFRWWLGLMLSAPRACNESGCFQKAVKNGFCEKHQAPVARAVKRIMTEVDGMYKRVRWLNFRRWIMWQNPICQKIERGRQCNNPATLVHHLWSPKVRPDLFIEPTNVICLCSHCHPPDEGTPFWRAGREFVATAFSNPTVG